MVGTIVALVGTVVCWHRFSMENIRGIDLCLLRNMFVEYLSTEDVHAIVSYNVFSFTTPHHTIPYHAVPDSTRLRPYST